MMYPQMGLVAAGGLVPSDLGVLDELVREFPDVSLDIESGVRNTDDAMVVSKAQEFLLRSLTLLQERKRAA